MLNDQLVAKSLLVLNVFCAQNGETGRGKNEILRATGSKDKPIIFETINFLKRANILQFKSFKQGKKGFITLTPLGFEMVELVALIKQSNDAYNSLRTKILEYLPLMRMYLDKYADKYDEDRHRNIVKEKLLQKEWNCEQIDYFLFAALSLLRTGALYRKDVCNSLLHRYSRMLSSFRVNERAKDILIKIIVDVITDILKSERDIVSGRLPPYDHNLYDFSAPVLKDINEFYKVYGAPNCFISGEIAGLMSSLVLLLKPPLKDFSIFSGIYSKIEHAKNRVNSLGNEQETFNDTKGRHYLKNLEELAKVIEPFERKYGNMPFLHDPLPTSDMREPIYNMNN